MLDQITNLYDSLKDRIVNLEAFVNLATIYIYITVPLMTLMFVVILVQWGSIRKVKAQNEEILSYLKNKE